MPPNPRPKRPPIGYSLTVRLAAEICFLGAALVLFAGFGLALIASGEAQVLAVVFALLGLQLSVYVYLRSSRAEAQPPAEAPAAAAGPDGRPALKLRWPDGPEDR